MYSGLQPAMTALAAMTSTVAVPQRGGIRPINLSGRCLVPAHMAATRSGVGGTTGKPSVHPFLWRKASWASKLDGARTRAAPGLDDVAAVLFTDLDSLSKKRPAWLGRCAWA